MARVTVSFGATLIFCLIFLPNAQSCRHDDTHCGEKEWRDHPVLCHMLSTDTVDFSDQLHDWAVTHGFSLDSLVLPTATVDSTQRIQKEETATKLPVVFAHGMGDSCFNSGMQHVVEYTSTLRDNAYAVCIPTGDTQAEDTRNGYFLNMDASVDVFAQKVKADDNLNNGFHAVGFSQGNNIIRGYIAKYNDPAVHTFISVNGVNAGIGAVPYCRPELLSSQIGHDSTFSLCDLLMEQASLRAYTEFAQKHSFQANYWRDPRPAQAENYREYCQLAKWNNEAGFVNETLRENWAKTQSFVWVLATEDGMVWPREGEQWGAPDPQNPFEHILTREETEWYQKDLFGLQTAEKAGKNHYESFEGDHLAFTQADFDRWIQSYLTD